MGARGRAREGIHSDFHLEERERTSGLARSEYNTMKMALGEWEEASYSPSMLKQSSETELAQFGLISGSTQEEVQQ